MGDFAYTDHLFEGKKDSWEIIVGLEVHAQIASQTKLFSGAPTSFGQEPNTHVSFLDAGFPGMLPVINKVCVIQGIKTGLGFEGRVNRLSRFDRKNYFYPDLPTGYQISQFSKPLIQGGYLEIEREDGVTRHIGITQLHLEQDAGKSLHDLYPDASAVDFNRAGTGLMEIVSEPDIRTIEEAALYVKKLRALLRCLGTCNGNMEEGNLRVDANVSVRRPGEPLGTRVEIKNLNSIRFLQQALAYEIQRQVSCLESGEQIIQETRLFDNNKGETRSMRNKEDAADYRYFPDPDLPPLVIDASFVEEIQRSLPELPDQQKKRFIQDFSLSPYDAGVLVSDQETALFFEKGVEVLRHASPKMLVHWITSELFGKLKRQNCTLSDAPISPENLGALVDMIASETISGKIAKDVFQEMWETQQKPQLIVEKNGLQQINDQETLEVIIAKILERETTKVISFQKGQEKLFGYFVGLLMKETQGRANPTLANTLLREALNT